MENWYQKDTIIIMVFEIRAVHGILRICYLNLESSLSRSHRLL